MKIFAPFIKSKRKEGEKKPCCIHELQHLLYIFNDMIYLKKQRKRKKRLGLLGLFLSEKRAS